MAKNYDEILAAIEGVRTEVLPEANTAARVGGAMKDILLFLVTEIEELKSKADIVVQTTGDSTTSVMSQKAVTDAISNGANIAKGSLKASAINGESPLLNELSLPSNWLITDGNTRLTSKYFFKLDPDFSTFGVDIVVNDLFDTLNVRLEVYDDNYTKLYGYYQGTVTNALKTYPTASWYKIMIHGIKKGDADATVTTDIVKYIRFHTSALTNPTLIEEGRIADKAVTTGKIADKAVTTGKIDDYAVDESKTCFFASFNLVNTNDADVALGQYIVQTGSTGYNADYNATGFIVVKPNTDYRIGHQDNMYMSARTLMFYDKDKAPIIDSYAQYVKTAKSPANAAFVRISFSTTSWLYAQFTEGDEYRPYCKYNALLERKYLTDLCFYLPKDIYVAAGRTIELYYEQILLGASKYNIQAECPVGCAMDRKFQIIGNEDKIGEYTLTIRVYDDGGTLLTFGTSTIHIVSSTIAQDIKILPIGDSLTNGKPWLDELTNLSDKIATVGTRNDKHEGRSGGNATTYTNVTGGEVYKFDSAYTGVGVDAPIFNESTSYSKGTLVRKTYTFGNGEGYNVYVFLQDHSAGVWNSSEVYSLSNGNPFYDFVNKKFSMNFYRTYQNKDFNAIIIYLGTNGINRTPEVNTHTALGIKNLISLIREEEATTPIIVVNTIFRASQNGIGKQGNTDGYQAQSEYKFNADMKVLLLAKALDDMVGDMENVYLCPVGFTHDSKYNFGNSKVVVNPRFEDTDQVWEVQPSDSVHPQTCGYLQMADEIFSTVCKVFTK